MNREEIMNALDNEGKKVRFKSSKFDITVERADLLRANANPNYVGRNNLLQYIENDAVFDLGSGNKPTLQDLLDSDAEVSIEKGYFL